MILLTHIILETGNAEQAEEMKTAFCVDRQTAQKYTYVKI